MLNLKTFLTGSLALVCAAGIAQAATPTKDQAVDNSVKVDVKKDAGVRHDTKVIPVAAAQAKPGASVETPQAKTDATAPVKHAAPAPDAKAPTEAAPATPATPAAPVAMKDAKEGVKEAGKDKPAEVGNANAPVKPATTAHKAADTSKAPATKQ